MSGTKLTINGIEIELPQLKFEETESDDTIANCLANLHAFLKAFHLNANQREKVIVALIKYGTDAANVSHAWSVLVNSVLIEEHIKKVQIEGSKIDDSDEIVSD